MSEILYSDVKFKTRDNAKNEDNGTLSTCKDTIYSEIKSNRHDQNQSSKAGNTSSQQQVESKVIPGGPDPVRVALVVLCVLLMGAVITLLVLYTTIKSEALQAKHLLNTSKALIERNHTVYKLLEKCQLTLKENKCPTDVNEDCTKDPKCGLDWKPFDGKCYYFSSDAKNWTESRDACISSGGHLVIIESEKEQEFLVKELVHKMNSDQLENKFWIGLTDQQDENTWLWVDNTKLKKSYWISRQPDDWKGENEDMTDGEDCVRMGEKTEVKDSWYDTSCSKLQRRICEAR